ncbi:hypothetical protein [Phycicoccus endophyticus]|uniref:hypothetical protein n=2 Tax=Phycicoccus endophyticus TaxID=1690220 RepID=UPI00166D18ED|nr:hypothetical protein [Phycicoccus endophyticus]
MPVRDVRARRAGWARAGLAVLLAGAALLTGCTGPGERPPRSVGGAGTAAVPAATSSAAAPGASAGVDPPAAALDTLLTRRERAVLAGDRAAFAATLADPASASGRRQLRSFAAARALGVRRLTHEVADPPAGTGAVSATVRYRLTGLDRAARSATVGYALRWTAAGWRVASERAVSGLAAPPWVAMPALAVQRGVAAVVAGTAPRAVLRETAATVEHALPALRRSWSRTPAQVLVLAPDTAAEAAALLGQATGAVGEVAATTEGPVGPDGRATGDEVVLDPRARRTLTAAGDRVVLTHELAHVAVRATLPGSAPRWLAEGYADHVGYAEADVPDSALLRPLARAVADGTAPARVPSADELDPAAGDLEVGYLAAWQVVEAAVARAGEDAVHELLRRCSVTGGEAAAERACDAAMPAVLGTDRAGLTRDWRRRLADLAP